MDIQEKKRELRRHFLYIRKNIPKKEYENYSDAIIECLSETTAYKQAKCIHCYVSMNERKEVNTHGLIRTMLAGEKRVVVPITNFNSGSLRHIELNSFDNLRPNKWGVLEPASGNSVSVDELDLVIVPMVAGDEDGNRLGYGKGFYDRFLAKTECFRVGLAFDCCITDNIPSEKFDITLNQIITENWVINPE